MRERSAIVIWSSQWFMPTAEDFTLNSMNDIEGVSFEKQIKPKGDFFFNLE